MFQVPNNSSEKLVLMANYKSEQKSEQVEESEAAKPKAICENGVCRLEWKPTRPSSSASAA